MRNANSQNGPQSEADARRAAERMNDATNNLGGMKSQQSTNQVDDLARQAGEALRKQQAFEGDLRKAMTQNGGQMTRQQANDLATQHEAQVNDLKKLETGMQNGVRDLMSTQRQTSSKLRQALSEMEQNELRAICSATPIGSAAV